VIERFAGIHKHESGGEYGVYGLATRVNEKDLIGKRVLRIGTLLYQLLDIKSHQRMK